jgi:hypothetical protein
MMYLLVLPLLFMVFMDPLEILDSGRRLMLEGDTANALTLLESVLEGTCSEAVRSRAGFLMEAIDQSEAFTAGEPGFVEALGEPELPAGSAAYAMTVIPGEAGGWVRGSYGLDLALSGLVLEPGDSIRVWIPLAENMPIQEADEPVWEAVGLETTVSAIHLGETGVLPVLYLSGVVQEAEGITLSVEQDFTAFGVAAPVSDPENIVLAVPGTSPETDRALASTDVIGTGGDNFILARRIAGSSPEPLVRLAAIEAFAMDSIAAGPVPWALYAAEGLSRAVGRTRRADGLCLAAFIASVCRVNGIPCRVTGGWLSTPGAPVRHSRVEYMLEEGTWTPLDIPMAVAAGREGLDGSPFLEGFCDAARVYTCVSLEDSLAPARNSWATCPPGSYPEVETRSPGGHWTAVPLRDVHRGTTVTLEWRS